MQKRAPTFGRVAIAGGFALSCFGLLLFLWLTFGGPVPLKPTGYRVTVPFQEATQLAVESDVRISGVSVGKVKSIDLSDVGLADAELEIDPKYAPIPADTKAILRQKTLLGETYVELTPGESGGPTLAENGALPAAQVSDAVQLDEIFRTFDEPTRIAFREWMANAAVATKGRGADLNAALGNLSPFAARADDLLTILDGQRNAVSSLISDGGDTFEALSQRRGELLGLIVNADRVFETTARRDAQLRATFTALPTFLDESRKTVDRLDAFAADTNPLITQLRPSARQLSGTLIELKKLSPKLQRFFNGLLPVNAAAARGFGALRALLDDDLPPALTRSTPFLNELTPIVQSLYRYRREVTGFVANVASATNSANFVASAGGTVKYLRSVAPLGPEAVASYPQRLKTNRTNAYVRPGGYTKLAQSMDSFLVGQCAGDFAATLDPASAAALPSDLYDRIQQYAFDGKLSTSELPAPACDEKAPEPSIGGSDKERTIYPHVRAVP